MPEKNRIGLDAAPDWPTGSGDDVYRVDIVGSPKIRVGTIHSAKGMEASKVVMLTSIGRRIRQSEEDDPARFAEERRIEYVGCTRAKHNLVVAHDPRERYRMELPL